MIVRKPLDAPQLPNEVWSLDFMSDSLYQGRRFRTLNILDESVPEALAIEIDTSLPAQRVVRTSQQLEFDMDYPKRYGSTMARLTSQYLADLQGQGLNSFSTRDADQNVYRHLTDVTGNCSTIGIRPLDECE